MARTRMPPSGKMPVSTAALRTSSPARAMAAGGMEMGKFLVGKLRIVLPQGFLFLKSKETPPGAVGTIIGLDRVTFAGFDRADERSRQHDLTGFEREVIRRD